ncbi:hypothetical protein PICST_32772 [Scheffersomyces stipitis CBS 6054]|uniref:Uncharacterized protein n=1 Tax=Scheffersomyces stipitis (strain ATCC 58785 / CBS 6054 / NBRC 10063 / NRRL Y-11545) TaxID=322104 RepID=A3LXC8_PICST|nr:hypothetical protein PICST_32772 [Scheffersomyces stipitis CBS 6054]ABN67436.2 hypothetical protein PICST_32772 [Scheffersomyces stipitis CBS 6054]
MHLFSGNRHKQLSPGSQTPETAVSGSPSVTNPNSTMGRGSPSSVHQPAFTPVTRVYSSSRITVPSTANQSSSGSSTPPSIRISDESASPVARIESPPRKPQKSVKSKKVSSSSSPSPSSPSKTPKRKNQKARTSSSSSPTKNKKAPSQPVQTAETQEESSSSPARRRRPPPLPPIDPVEASHSVLNDNIAERCRNSIDEQLERSTILAADISRNRRKSRIIRSEQDETPSSSRVTPEVETVPVHEVLSPIPNASIPVESVAGPARMEQLLPSPVDSSVTSEYRTLDPAVFPSLSTTPVDLPPTVTESSTPEVQVTEITAPMYIHAETATTTTTESLENLPSTQESSSRTDGDRRTRRNDSDQNRRERRVRTDRSRQTSTTANMPVTTSQRTGSNQRASNQRTRERRLRRRRRRTSSDVESIPSLPPPQDEYTDIHPYLHEDSPPYREKLHKYVDLISFDPRYTIPVLRFNKALINNDKKLQKCIKKLSQFNLLPSEINLWDVDQVDDREFYAVLPSLLPELDGNGGPHVLGQVLEMERREQENTELQIAMELSLHAENQVVPQAIPASEEDSGDESTYFYDAFETQASFSRSSDLFRGFRYQEATNYDAASVSDTNSFNDALSSNLSNSNINLVNDPNQVNLSNSRDQMVSPAGSNNPIDAGRLNIRLNSPLYHVFRYNEPGISSSSSHHGRLVDV